MPGGARTWSTAWTADGTAVWATDSALGVAAGVPETYGLSAPLPAAATVGPRPRWRSRPPATGRRRRPGRSREPSDMLMMSTWSVVTAVAVRVEGVVHAQQQRDAAAGGGDRGAHLDGVELDAGCDADLAADDVGDVRAVAAVAVDQPLRYSGLTSLPPQPIGSGSGARPRTARPRRRSRSRRRRSCARRSAPSRGDVLFAGSLCPHRRRRRNRGPWRGRRRPHGCSRRRCRGRRPSRRCHRSPGRRGRRWRRCTGPSPRGRSCSR